MKVGHRVVSETESPLIIAEIGINHGGDLEVAKRMTSLAAKSSCEIIKHQTHIVEDEMTEEAKEIFPPNADKSIWDIMKECALSKDDEIALKEHVESLGMIYMSTPFSRAAADFLNDIGVSAFKIGSGECNHLPLIRHIAKFRKPVILSTGMQRIENIRGAVTVLKDAGVEYALLQCSNLYPTPPNVVSLRGISELRTEFPGAIVGFSDHSIGPEMALASVALGACIVERHYTDSRYRCGPDISCSMDPAELRYLIDRSCEIHTALQKEKQRSVPEEAVYRFARASIVADRDLQEGSIISEEDIWARRPGSGEISVEHFDLLIGATLRRSMKKNEQLTWSDVDGVKRKSIGS